jgi:hypothetical protein
LVEALTRKFVYDIVVAARGNLMADTGMDR